VAECSKTLPLYCKWDFELFNYCSKCGCEDGYICDISTQECVEKPDDLFCLDSSSPGECSLKRPLFCDYDLELINLCEKCGCSEGYYCDALTQDCIIETDGAFCSDSTPQGECAEIPPLYCNADLELTPFCEECGCREGYECKDQGFYWDCVLEESSCSDLTPPQQCSLTLPWYCTSGLELINDCMECGCDAGYTCNYLTNGCVVDSNVPTCGNDILEAGEFCDDGNTINGDGCSDICLNECGDRIVDVDGTDGYSESCEVDPIECPDDPTIYCVCPDDAVCVDCECILDWSDVVCGDGVLEADEECDDGNLVSGDGCDGTCDYETVDSDDSELRRRSTEPESCLDVDGVCANLCIEGLVYYGSEKFDQECREYHRNVDVDLFCCVFSNSEYVSRSSSSSSGNDGYGDSSNSGEFVGLDNVDDYSVGSETSLGNSYQIGAGTQKLFSSPTYAFGSFWAVGILTFIVVFLAHFFHGAFSRFDYRFGKLKFNK